MESTFPSDLNFFNWKKWTVEMPKEMPIGPITYEEYLRRNPPPPTQEEIERRRRDQESYDQFVKDMRPYAKAVERRIRRSHHEWVGDGSFCNGCE